MLKLFLLFFLSFNIYAQCELSYVTFENINGARKLEEVKELKIASYNVFNLQVSPGKFVVDPATGVKTFTAQTLRKDPNHTQEIANIILNENLDIVILQEVEGIQALRHFNQFFLRNLYHELVIAGNDTRGIEIAFLIKKDLKLKYKFTTNKHILAQSSSELNPTPLFSRDLPVLHLWPSMASGTDPPSLIIMGNHLKSQRNRKGDIKSVAFRSEQARKIAEITQDYQQIFPNTPIILGGDFNADLNTSLEFSALFHNGLFKDAFDLVEGPLKAFARVTHTFHPLNGSTVLNQLDGFLINSPGRSKVKDIKVYRYINSDGTPRALPQNNAQRDQNPSDHYPVIMNFSL